ncbi:class I SAM-dependent methyltransferase [Amycolatopsis sp. La24]|uniref:class I SAM-dependent DNA methyltransferase n=1 Tax=Amycolatopsis sp. La24 TaxID=3028304 RepID=UPI0023AF8E65|nr:class I SAM-dependent methyltransferase [Amycolatopsis sp. La24]
MAAYDEIADWYEEEFLRAQPVNPGASALRDLLGEGSGVCLEIGCGTGVHADLVRELGWTPLGVDLSSGMLRHARARQPTAQADAARLPIRDRSVDAVVSVLVHRSCWRSVRSSALQEPRTSTAPTVCSRIPARRTGRWPSC